MSAESLPAHRAWLAALLLLVFGVYARSLANDYCYDDRYYVNVPSDQGLPNDLVGEWQGLSEYFTSFYGERAVSGGRGFRPLTVASFAIVHGMFASRGMPGAPPPTSAGAQHFVNVALHVLVTWLVFLLFRRLFASPWPAVAAAACFGFHALRSDPVISIVGRAEILALGLGIGAQLLYLSALRRNGGGRAVALGGAGLCLFLAFCSKESSMAWIAFLPLFAIVCLGREDPSRTLGAIARAQALPWFSTVIVPLAVFGMLWYPILATEEFAIETVNNPLQRLDLLSRLTTAVMVLGHALVQIVLPYPLHIDYSFNALPIVEDAGDYRFLLSFTVLAALLGGGLWSARRAPVLFLATAMFFGFAFVTSNIPVIVETIYGERLMYTPAVGLCFVAAWVADRVGPGSSWRKPLLALAVVWIGANSVIIFQRCGAWRDNRTLFLHEADTQPNSQRRQMAAGRQYRLEGQAIGFRGPRGEECFAKWNGYLLRALNAHPDRNHPTPLNDLAFMHLTRRDVLLARGDSQGAEREETAAERRIQQAFASPFFETTGGGTLHYLMSRIFERRGQRSQQFDALRQSLEANPNDPDAYMRLAEMHMRNRRGAEAVAMMRRGVARFPDVLPIRVRAIDLSNQVGDERSFLEMLEAGERQHPNGNPHMQAFRGVWLSRRGRHPEALQLFGMAMPRFRPQSPPPTQVFLAIPTSLAAVGEHAQARGFLEQHLQNPNLSPPIRTAMQSLYQGLPK